MYCRFEFNFDIRAWYMSWFRKYIYLVNREANRDDKNWVIGKNL